MSCDQTASTSNAASTFSMSNENAASTFFMLNENAASTFSMSNENAASTFSMSNENAASTSSMSNENAASTFSMSNENAASTSSMSNENAASTSSMSNENAASTFSMSNENAAMNIQRSEEISSSQKYFNRHTVRAAELLLSDSSTEVVAVSKLTKKCTSLIRYVEIGATGGRLYCVNNLMSTACWIRIVSFANDCYSYNVLLMFTTDGVQMKAIRNIDLGEELLMWFDNDILTILHMSFLRPFNIQGHNRYVCHICNKWFEFPNPLKVHIALKCDQLGINHFWAVLKNEFNSAMMPHYARDVVVPITHAAGALAIEAIIDNLERSSNGYNCFYCEKVFTKKHYLKFHIRTHTGFKPFTCIYCNQAFRKRINWTAHLRSHLSNVNYMG